MSTQKHEYVTHEKISLKNHSELNEKWLQDVIAKDPSILGLGDLVLKDRERLQPRAGRLDLLLQDVESNTRYEIEIQLGKTDESHIIRTLEYWDIERKRYPQYDHVAVIIAEDITSRFLNVISLFNGVIPIIAIQVHTVKIDNKVTLVFTRVLDQMKMGLVDEDEVAEITDRPYWEKKAAKSTLKMVDDILTIIKEKDPEFSLNYNKYYIGLAKGGQSNNFVVFGPKKKYMHFSPRLEKDTEIEEKINNLGFDYIYENRNGRYRITLYPEDIAKNKEFLAEIVDMAYRR